MDSARERIGPRTSIPSRRSLVLVVMCAGMFLVLLDVSVVNVALPAMSFNLHTQADGVQWVVDGYAVTIASFLLAGGSVGDRIGHRGVVLAGLAVFGLASAGCSLAPTIGALVAARAAQGVGAALLLPGSIAVITDAYPDRAEQARALGIWSGVSSLALPAGPLLGGALVTLGGWPLVFLINIPIVAVALVTTAWLVPGSRDRSPSRPDLFGLLGATVTLASVVFFVIDLGHHGVRAASVVAGATAVTAGTAFVFWQRRAPAPMLPISLLRFPAFAGANISALLMNLNVNGTLLVSTLFLQQIQHHSPSSAGLALLPLFIPLAVLAPITGRLTARYGPRSPMLTGGVIAAAGAVSLVLVEPGGSYLRLAPALLGLGLGAGLFTAAVVAAAVRAVPLERSGLASGVNNAARQTGTALGIAIFGAIAGSPASPTQFVLGMHHLGVLGAGCWIAALLITTWTVPRGSTSSRLMSDTAAPAMRDRRSRAQDLPAHMPSAREQTDD